MKPGKRRVEVHNIFFFLEKRAKRKENKLNVKFTKNLDRAILVFRGPNIVQKPDHKFHFFSSHEFNDL